MKTSYFVPFTINSLSPGVPFLYHPKILENQRFSDIFRGYKTGTLGHKGLKNEASKNFSRHRKKDMNSSLKVTTEKGF